MQPIEPETYQQQTFPVMVQPTKMTTTLSPPPGFIDNDAEEESIRNGDDEEPSLSGDDFASVGSITFKDAPIEPVPSKQPGYFFGQQDDNEDDSEDEEEPPIKAVERNTTRVVYFEPDHPPAAAANPTETLIEREIRLQKEREEAVLRERQLALEMLESRKLQQQQQQQKKEAPMCFKPAQPPVVIQQQPVEQPQPPVASVKREPVSKKTSSGSSDGPALTPAEIRISEEIRELKEREEELRRRHREENQLVSLAASGGATEDEGLGGFSDPERDVSSSNSSEATSRYKSHQSPSHYLQSQN